MDELLELERKVKRNLIGYKYRQKMLSNEKTAKAFRARRAEQGRKCRRNKAQRLQLEKLFEANKSENVCIDPPNTNNSILLRKSSKTKRISPKPSPKINNDKTDKKQTARPT